MRPLAAAAQKEGKLLFYTGMEETVVVALGKAFKEAFGVALEYQRLNSGEVAARYSAEASAGHTAADVVLTGDLGLFHGFADKGWFAKLDPASVPGLAEWPAEYKDEYAPIVTIEPQMLAINTQLVTTTPTDWTFLLDPQLKGAIITTDLKKVGMSAFDFWDLLLKAYGDEFLRKVGQQQLRLFDSGASGVQQLAAGAGKVFCPCPATFAQAMADQGAPIKGILPDGKPCTGMTSPAAVSAQAPHPNAARLFVSFLLSPDGQKILNKVAASPNNTPGSLPIPKGFVKPDVQSATANRSKIMALLQI
jgi:iron(III) transport system substrate-binding protein